MMKPKILSRRTRFSDVFTEGKDTTHYNMLHFSCRYWEHMVSVIEHQKVARRRRPTGTGRTPRKLRGIQPIRIARKSGAPAVKSARKNVPVRFFATPHGISIDLPRADYPVLAAVIVFAIFANLMLLSFRSDRIILSGVLSGIAPPPAQELVMQSRITPQENEFAVIGEVAGVDPSRFARLEVETYTVRPGDTLGEIALRYGLEMDTLISFNQIEDVRRLQAGTTMEVPNRDGLLYTVKGGDSLSSIAGRHETTVNAILDANDMKSQVIDVGQVIFVPGARLNDTERRIILGELFAWPARGTFTSGFGMRADPFTGYPRFHNGVDMASRIGTPIRAAASGRVVHIETQVGNYGRFVILRHPDGFQTLYAHMDSFSVRNGQYVDRGTIIGSMGNTGRSTGPHLHFSVIHNGTFVDPLRYLH